MDTTRLSKGVAVALGALALLTLTACSTATPTATPGVERLGATVLRYSGPEVDAVLSYRYASLNPGEEWLFLDVAITGKTRTSVEIKRDNISLLTPTGDVVPLASQEEFGQAYAQLAAALARADVAAEPLDYFPSRTSKALSFLVIPGTGLALDSVWVNDLEVATGRLYFDLPAGVQAGHYELRIDLQESKVRIPFRLGAQG
jgi:hypothetical protein